MDENTDQDKNSIKIFNTYIIHGRYNCFGWFKFFTKISIFQSLIIISKKYTYYE